MRFSICVMEPEGYKYSHFLYDICKYLCFGIESAGYDCCILRNKCSSDRVNIIVGAHNLTDPAIVGKIKQSGNFILLQSEIVKGDTINNWSIQKSFANVYLPLLRQAQAVWDGVESNIGQLQQFGIDAEFLQFGYHPLMEEIHHKQNKDIDFLFCGSITPHREKLLNQLIAHGGNVYIMFDDAAMYRNDLIARARVNLQPNHGPDMNHFGGSRVLYLINNRAVIAVERCHDQAIYEHCFPSADTEQWVDLCMETLRRPDLAKITEEYYERFKKIKMVDFIAPLIDKFLSMIKYSSPDNNSVKNECHTQATDAVHSDNLLQPTMPAVKQTIINSKQMEKQNIGYAGIFSADKASIIPSLSNSEFTKGMTSIIIPVYSGYLHECVSSIKKYTKEPYEIIFVSCDAGPHIKKLINKTIRENNQHKVIESNTNVKFIQSINEGINQSTGEYIILLFDDVTVFDGWLSDMFGYLESSENTGIVGPMSDSASAMQKAENVNYRSPQELISFRERNKHRRIYVRNLEGFCLLFRRSLLSSINLFDETFGANKHVFDDFCARAVLEGFTNVIAGNVYVHTEGAWNKLLSRDKAFFDEKWQGLDASNSLAEKVLTVNSMDHARSLFNKGMMVGAVNTLIGRIGFSPDENILYYLLAEILIEEKRYQDALDALKGLTVTKDDAQYYEILGYANEGLGSYSEAAEYTGKALAVNSKSAPALNLKGILAYRNTEPEKAAKHFLQALEADPGYGETYTNLGMLKWQEGKKEEALALFEKGFILSPDRHDVITAYYDVINAMELYGRAENIFREARAAYPENKRILFLLIDILLKQNKYPEAMKQVEGAMVQQGMDEGILAAALEIRKIIGPKSITANKTKKSKAAPTLSVCMIVKNEEKHLAYCLNSLTPVADEMIVVDTGSTDKTKEIAVAFGAQTFDMEWINDFSAARNYSLEQAKGDWILVMDADEVISAQDYAKIRKLLIQKEKIAYTLVTRNYVYKTTGDGWVCNDNSYIYEQGGRGWFPSSKVRLFPNNRNIRFEKPIHELVEYSLEKIGMGWKVCGVPVHHYGELDTAMAAAKDEQYYELGLKKMKESGGDFKSVWELAVQAGELGKFDESIELWHKVLGFKKREATVYFNLANHYLSLKNYAESYECSRKAYSLDPRDQSTVLSFAMSEFLAGDIHKTISALEGFLQGSNSQTSHAALLAVSYLLTGKTDEGLKFLRRGVKQGYNIVYYLLDLSQTLISAGNVARAKSLLTAAIDIKYCNPETLALLDKCQADSCC